VVTFNLVNFARILLAIWRIPVITDGSDAKRYAKAKRGFRASASFLPVMGITWVFGLLAIEPNSSIVWVYLFTVCTALQGILIFIFHFCRDALVRRTFLGAIGLGHWANRKTGSRASTHFSTQSTEFSRGDMKDRASKESHLYATATYGYGPEPARQTYGSRRPSTDPCSKIYASPSASTDDGMHASSLGMKTQRTRRNEEDKEPARRDTVFQMPSTVLETSLTLPEAAIPIAAFAHLNDLSQIQPGMHDSLTHAAQPGFGRPARGAASGPTNTADCIAVQDGQLSPAVSTTHSEPFFSDKWSVDPSNFGPRLLPNSPPAKWQDERNAPRGDEDCPWPSATASEGSGYVQIGHKFTALSPSSVSDVLDFQQGRQHLLQRELDDALGTHVSVLSSFAVGGNRPHGGADESSRAPALTPGQQWYEDLSADLYSSLAMNAIAASTATLDKASQWLLGAHFMHEDDLMQTPVMVAMPRALLQDIDEAEGQRDGIAGTSEQQGQE